MTPEEGLSNPIVERSTDLTGSPEADAGQALRKRAEALARISHQNWFRK